MSLPKESFLTFPEPFDAVLDERKVNGSWPQLHSIGITSTRIKIKGVSRDETTLLIDSEPKTPNLLPQVAKRVVIFNDQMYEKQATAVGLRTEDKKSGKTEGRRAAATG